MKQNETIERFDVKLFYKLFHNDESPLLGTFRLSFNGKQAKLSKPQFTDAINDVPETTVRQLQDIVRERFEGYRNDRRWSIIWSEEDCIEVQFEEVA